MFQRILLNKNFKNKKNITKWKLYLESLSVVFVGVEYGVLHVLGPEQPLACFYLI